MGLLGGRTRTMARDAGRGCRGDLTLNAAACRCWPEREGRAHITLPRPLRKSTTPAADGTLPGRAHFPHRGFIEYSWAGADPRAKGQAPLLHSDSGTADSGAA